VVEQILGNVGRFSAPRSGPKSRRKTGAHISHIITRAAALSDAAVSEGGSDNVHSS
jgi:hypothetical protein